MRSKRSAKKQRHIRAKVVEAECFRVVDSAGRERGEFTTMDDSIGLKLRDSTERIGLWLQVLDDGRPEVWLFGPDGTARALLCTNLSDTARLFLKDSYGRTTEISTMPDARTVKIEVARQPVRATSRGCYDADRIRHWRS